MRMISLVLGMLHGINIVVTVTKRLNTVEELL